MSRYVMTTAYLVQLHFWARTDTFGVKLLHTPMPRKIRACEPVTNPPSLGAQNHAWPKEGIKQIYKKDADDMWLVI